VESAQPSAVAPPECDGEPGDEQQPHEVQDEGVGEVEVANGERLTDQWLVEVHIDHHDERPNEERGKAPDDAEVPEPCDPIPVEVLPVGQGYAGGCEDAFWEVVKPRECIFGTPSVPPKPADDVEEEEQKGDGGEIVKECFPDRADRLDSRSSHLCLSELVKYQWNNMTNAFRFYI